MLMISLHHINWWDMSVKIPKLKISNTFVFEVARFSDMENLLRIKQHHALWQSLIAKDPARLHQDFCQRTKCRGLHDVLV
jgi:hypothetical protein